MGGGSAVKDSGRVTGAVIAGSVAVAAGTGTAALADTLGHTGSGTAAAIGGIAAFAAAATGAAVSVWTSRDGVSVNGHLGSDRGEPWPELRWADFQQRSEPPGAGLAQGLAGHVYSRWCESSRSLRQASEALAAIPLPDLPPVRFGRAWLDSRGRVVNRERQPEADSFFRSGRDSPHIEWAEIRASVTGRQRQEAGPWTLLADSGSVSSERSFQMRLLLTAIKPEDNREQILVGVVSPMSALTETVFGLIRDAFGVRSAHPRFQIRDLRRPGVLVRSARFITPDVELVERYRSAAGFFNRAGNRSSDEIEGVTLALGNANVNIFSDGQVYLHNVFPEDVPIVISKVAPVVWPPSG
jgi:hypothetical protein